SGLLHGRANEDESTLGTGDGTLDEGAVVLAVYGVDREVLGGVLDSAHTAGRAHTLEHATRCRGAADRTWLAVIAVLTMGGTDAAEAVTLHHTGGSLALGRRGHIALASGIERVDAQFLAERVVSSVCCAQLHEVTARGHAGLLEVACSRLVDLARIDLAERDLHCGVTVGLLVADLRHDVVSGGHNGHRHEVVLLIPHLGHAQFGAQKSLDVLGRRESR